MPRVARRRRIGRKAKNYQREPYIKNVKDQLVPLHVIEGAIDSKFWALPDLVKMTNDDISIQNDGMSHAADINETMEHYVILDKVYKIDKDIDLDIFVQQKNQELYLHLRDNCQELVKDSLFEKFEFVRSSPQIRYVSLYDGDSPRVKLSVTIKPDFRTEIYVHDKKLNNNHQLWSRLPSRFIRVEQVRKLLTSLLYFEVCIGNPDEELQKLFSGKLGYLETGFIAQCANLKYNSTIRSVNCMLLKEISGKAAGLRCKECGTYRRTLKKQEQRWEVKIPTECIDWITSKKGNSRLTECEKIEKIKQLRNYSMQLKGQVEFLKRKLDPSTKGEVMTLIDSDDYDMFIMKCNEQFANEEFPLVTLT